MSLEKRQLVSIRFITESFKFKEALLKRTLNLSENAKNRES